MSLLSVLVAPGIDALSRYGPVENHLICFQTSTFFAYFGQRHLKPSNQSLKYLSLCPKLSPQTRVSPICESLPMGRLGRATFGCHLKADHTALGQGALDPSHTLLCVSNAHRWTHYVHIVSCSGPPESQKTLHNTQRTQTRWDWPLDSQYHAPLDCAEVKCGISPICSL